MKLKFTILLISFLLISLTDVQSTEAYSYTNKWATNSTTYRYGGDLPSSFQGGTTFGADVWTNVTTSRWVYVFVSTSSNYVGYKNIDGSGNVAAVTSLSLSGNTITWFKIEYDNSENWYTGTGTPASNQLDLRSVAAHEFGHALGLNHTQSNNCPGGSNNATMCPSLPLTSTYARSLETDDRNGVTAMYP
jgi:hypothetical protein